MALYSEEGGDDMGSGVESPEAVMGMGVQAEPHNSFAASSLSAA